MHIGADGHVVDSVTIDGTIDRTFEDFFITRVYNESTGEVSYVLYDIIGGYMASFNAEIIEVAQTLSDGGVLLRCIFRNSDNSYSYTYYTVK